MSCLLCIYLTLRMMGEMSPIKSLVYENEWIPTWLVTREFYYDCLPWESHKIVLLKLLDCFHEYKSCYMWFMCFNDRHPGCAQDRKITWFSGVISKAEKKNWFHCQLSRVNDSLGRVKQQQFPGLIPIKRKALCQLKDLKGIWMCSDYKFIL